MAKRNFTTLISELTEGERKLMEGWVHPLSLVLRQCGSRVQLDGTGEDTSIHLLGDIDALRGLLKDCPHGLDQEPQTTSGAGAQSRNQSGQAAWIRITYASLMAVRRRGLYASTTAFSSQSETRNRQPIELPR
jgi:hypothetical protein